jgi:hypothetical protein
MAVFSKVVVANPRKEILINLELLFLSSLLLSTLLRKDRL